MGGFFPQNRFLYFLIHIRKCICIKSLSNRPHIVLWLLYYSGHPNTSLSFPQLTHLCLNCIFHCLKAINFGSITWWCLESISHLSFCNIIPAKVANGLLQWSITGKPANIRVLSWRERLQIALESAQGLALTWWNYFLLFFPFLGLLSSSSSSFPLAR